MRLRDSRRTLYLVAGAVVVICSLVAMLWLPDEKVEDEEDLVDALRSANEVSNEIILISEQRMLLQDDVIRVQGEQISTLERQIGTLERQISTLERQISTLESLLEAVRGEKY